MMTIEEMKLAVCEKLPELIEIRIGGDCELPDSAVFYFWRNSYQINWPTEGLQVCHEAEKLLVQGQHIIYCGYLQKLGDCLYPNCEMKLESLCRVWFPERF